MGLFGSLNVGRNAVLTNQVALDVVGNNIANAENEGYSRQQVNFETLPPSRYGQQFVGNGVAVADVRRVFDQQVENRLKTAVSTLGSLDRQSAAYEQLERVINALGDDPTNGVYVSLGGQLTEFQNELSNLAGDPTSQALRSITISSGEALATTFNKLSTDVNDLRFTLNESVKAAVQSVNEKTVEIAQLNEEIVRAEVGGSLDGQANDLRDRRDFLIRELAKVSNIETVEHATGAVDIRVGGHFLVSGNDHFAIETRVEADRGVDIVIPEFEINGNPFQPAEGELGGLLIARDDILPSFMSDLDQMARTFMQTFNEVHATGRGINGLKNVTSTAFTPTHVLQNNMPISIVGTVSQGNDAGTFLVDPSLRGFPSGQANPEYFVGAKVLFTGGENEGKSATITRYDPGAGRLDLTPPLNSSIEAGDSFEITSLDYPIENGSFKLNVRNEVTGITDVFDIEVDRDGLPTAPNLDDTSVQDLINDINDQLTTFYAGNSPLVARVNDDYQIEISAADNDFSFHFSDDTSGFLAAAGMNTFFGGSNAASIHVKEEIRNDSTLLATALSSAPGDNGNVQRMVALGNEKLFNGGTADIQDFYRGIIGTIAVESKTAQELAANQELIAQSALNAREMISGVNVDEEAIDLIRFQRAFQAASRYIGVVDQLLQELISIV